MEQMNVKVVISYEIITKNDPQAIEKAVEILKELIRDQVDLGLLPKQSFLLTEEPVDHLTEYVEIVG